MASRTKLDQIRYEVDAQEAADTALTVKVETDEIENTGNITFDAINAAADSTVTVQNSDSTYKADLVVEGEITSTEGIVNTAEVTNAGNIVLDPVNAAADAEVQITNSDGTFKADLVVEGEITSTQGVLNLATSTAITGESAAAAAKIALAEDTDNGTNTTTIQAPAAITSNRTVTLPDADVDLTRLTATAGTGTASMALVLDASGHVAMPDAGFFRHSADTLAAAGSTSADAAALVDQVTIVTGADGAKGVVMAAAADLGEYTVINDSPTYAVKIYPVDSGDDVINELASDEPFILGPGQTVTLKAISATQWYAAKEAGRPTRETHFEVFDDFTYATFDETDNWISFEGAGATAAAVVTAPEGKIDLINGANGDATDGVSMSLILLAQGSLVSLGTTVFECRVSSSVLTGCNMTFGLSDTLAEANEHGLYVASAGTVSDGGLTLTNAACFLFDSDATASTNFLVVSENAGTISNAGAEEDSGVTPVANTYNVLRIEIDASGDARFYIDGALVKTEATAVATTALLIPFISVDEAGTSAANTLSVDYVLFQGARPSSNA